MAFDDGGGGQGALAPPPHFFANHVKFYCFTIVNYQFYGLPPPPHLFGLVGGPARVY